VVRTQIYLDKTQTERLDQLAGSSGTSRSELIRCAIDSYIAEHDNATADRRERFRRALDATFGIAKDLPDGEQYVEATRRGGADRFRALWGDDRL
jgi:predicted transcriptional regulator